MTKLSQEQLQSLKVSELRYRRLFETARDGILLLNADTGAVVAANPFICDLLNRTEQSLLNSFLWELGPLKEVIPSRDKFAELQSRGYVRYEDIPLETPAGQVVHVEFISNVYQEGEHSIIQCNIRDTTERFEIQRKLEHYVQTLVTINKCNSSLLQNYNEQALGNAICKALVIEGGFAAVWLGLEANEDGKILLKFTSSGGLDRSELPSEVILQADRLEDSELISALKTREAFSLNSQLTERLPRVVSQLIEQKGFQSCAVIPLPESVDIDGLLIVFSFAADRFDSDTLSLLSRLTDDLGFGISDIRVRAEHNENQKKLVRSFDQAIEAIATTTELRDPYTAGHQARVADLAAAIATEMGLSSEIRSTILMAAGVHDIGKIQVPAEILTYPGRLSPAQFEIIKSHPQAGFQILEKISFTQPIAEIVLQHHERLDGSGYPRQLKGEQILIEAQIISVADTVEAMSSHRPYRAGLGIDAALKEVCDHKGTQYNAEAVDACLYLFKHKGYEFLAV